MDKKMDDKELRKNLQQLHDEITNTRAVDDKGRELLRDLEGDISALLERSEETPVQVHPSIIRRLESALDHFEVTHPDLTMLISRLLDSLSTAGL